MSNSSQKVASAPRASPGGKSRAAQRRRRIFRSLHDCILARGYVKTTLAEIAEGAGMSASHLLYYFKGKEAILEQYFADVSERFLARLATFDDLPPRERIHAIGEFWFLSEASTRKEIGFMLECFGAAVNDEVLRITKADFDARCKKHLLQVFEIAPSLILPSAKDAAELAYALMIGLRSAVYFDDDIDLPDAYRLFTSSMLRLGGLS